ncbi:hypothetical protein [Novipirellula artificiosorum]|nr:hypothetical protein [Novipirellula artificiosorum]
MPIRLNCQCGKTLNIPDNLAGKAVKCPGCATVLKVPAAKATASPAAAPGVDSLDDLFDEEGFSDQVAAVCPACRAEMRAGAVLCTKCGFNKETGGRLEGHKTVGVDISHGTLALQKAAEDMARTQDTQDRMLSKAGLPWWMLGLILILLAGSTLIAVIAINVARRSDGTQFNAMATFMVLAGASCSLIGSVAGLMLLIKAFQKDVVTGLLCMFIPLYIFYFVAKNFAETWRLMAINLIMGGAGGALLAIAIPQLPI